jgi:hypothetical protein
MRGVMRLEEEGEVGIQGCLNPKPDNYFFQDYTWIIYLPFFGFKDRRVRKSLFSTIGLWFGYPLARTVCGIT